MPKVEAVPKPQPRPRKAINIPTNIRKQIHDRDQHICRICGRYGNHLHHKIPRSRGGKHTLDNLVTLCFVCHMYCHEGGKGLTAREWQEKILIGG